MPAWRTGPLPRAGFGSAAVATSTRSPTGPRSLPDPPSDRRNGPGIEPGPFRFSAGPRRRRGSGDGRMRESVAPGGSRSGARDEDRGERASVVADARGTLVGAGRGHGERDAVRGIGLRERRDRELGTEDDAQAAILADDLRPRPRSAVGGDQDGVGFLAQRVADQEIGRGAARAEGVTAVEPVLGDRRQQVLVEIREPLAIRGEAFVTEPLEEVARIHPERALVVLRGLARRESLEAVDVELYDGVAVEADRVLVGLEPRLGVDPGRREARADEPQGLAKTGRRGNARLGPQLG